MMNDLKKMMETMADENLLLTLQKEVAESVDKEWNKSKPAFRGMFKSTIGTLGQELSEKIFLWHNSEDEEEKIKLLAEIKEMVDLFNALQISVSYVED